MTFEERLAALGVDLSDLQEYHSMEKVRQVEQACFEWALKNNKYGIGMGVAYIMHLVHIIDILETRLDNVTGELDYLVKICTNCRDCRSCKSYDICDDEDIECNQYYSAYEYAGIPEDWSADDEQS